MRISILTVLSLSLTLAACGDKDEGSETGDAGADGSDGADGASDGSDGTEDADNDGDGYPASEDCDDTNPDINPDAEEVCDEFDNNCDGEVDEGVKTVFYADADGDGFAGDSIMVEACAAPDGFEAEATDCDDLNADVNPDAAEVCDGWDNDCDELVDDDDDSIDTDSQITVYTDGDGDGYGDDSTAWSACSAGSGESEWGGDCDDGNADINPETLWYIDFDGDGYGYAAVTTAACEAPEGYVADNTDCDEANAEINPGATEVCDDLDVDENCTGDADDADATVDITTYPTYYIDSDTDGYGDPEVSISQCDLPSGYTTDWSDCDDSAIAVNPGEAEVCNDGIDNDCSGDAPECVLSGDYTDADADVVFEGTYSGGDFGERFDMLDMNGDGYADLVASEWDYSGTYGDDGRAGIWLGPVTASTDMDSADAVVEGEAYYDRIGFEVASAGDLDADGYDDLLLGAYGHSGSSSTRGAAYLIYGSATVTGTWGTSDVAAASFYGPGNSGDYFGYELARTGDLNADGYGDIAIGGYGIDTVASNGGAVYIFHGPSTGFSGAYTYSDADITFNGDSSTYRVGYDDTVGITDLDGDGSNDYMLGSYYASSSYYGSVFMHYGALSSGTYAAEADANATISGSSGIFDYFGRAVFANPDGWDFNGDGYNDFGVYEYYGNSDAGAFYVFNGSSTQWSGSYDAATVAQVTFSGANSYDYLGAAAVTADLNGDGWGDLALGAGSDDSGASTGGAVYGYYGPSSVSGTVVSATTNDFAIDGASETSMHLGWYRMAAGDQNADGVNDLFVGADGYGISGGIFMFNGAGQ
jgi:hypothetical protein